MTQHSMAQHQPRGIIPLFATHRVAANLLMFLLILAGAWGIKQLNTQFFPNFELDMVTVSVVWSGASAEDVERNITVPIEQELESVNFIDEVVSSSDQGIASIRIVAVEGADISRLKDEVQQKVDGLRNFPEDAEQPVVQQIIRYDEIAKILITGDVKLEELRPLVRSYERSLLDQGIKKVEISGLPEKEIAIEIPTSQLYELNLSLTDIASRIDDASQDLPAGTLGNGSSARQVRAMGQQRSVEGFNDINIISEQDGQLVKLGDVAIIQERAQKDQVVVEYQGQPAVELSLFRTENEDTLKAAKTMRDWVEDTIPTLPQGIELHVYEEKWELVQGRINLLLKNGLGGLVLVIGILFLFLNVRVAFWVTVGIPVSFLAALAVMYLIGGSINMISLFGLIMALGIIVDDAIVVGEDSLSHYQNGESGSQAAIGGARRMLAPVVASSLTTIAAFLPLSLIGGIIGNILIDIPTVVICVIIASLVECFLILPGHLHHSLKNQGHGKEGKMRQWIDQRFNHFRDNQFHKTVRLAVHFRWVTLAIAITIFVFAIGLVSGGRIKFTFFPEVDGDSITANVQFASGTDNQEIDRFLAHLEASLESAEAEFDKKLVDIAIRYNKRAQFTENARADSGDEYGSLFIQLVAAEDRKVPNIELIDKWRSKIIMPAGLERLSINQATSGPPGKPIEVKLSGGSVETLKAASIDLQDILQGYNGVLNIEDDLPYGTEQWIYALNTQGQSLGLNLRSVGNQLRAALDGRLVQLYYDNDDEIEVRVSLPNDEQNRLSMLEQFPLALPNGDIVPLSNVIDIRTQRGLDTLKRVDGQLAIIVKADIDDAQTNANEVLTSLAEGPLKQITGQYGISYSFEGKKADERETMADMLIGAGLAFVLIYIILAWVFSSYLWALAVMATIPLGITGAILGHMIMGQNLTLLSLFGIFGLSGIVINDSIVLITFYRSLREQGVEHFAAIIQAARQRLRAVLLTSLTTIAGLSPILLETSLQAQFLIPMATSLVFGLAYGTLLILLLIPSLLMILEPTNKAPQ